MVRLPSGGGGIMGGLVVVLMLAVLEIAKVRGRVGRPTVLTDEVLSKIGQLRADGLGYKRIAREIGIGRTTVRRVLGKAGDGEGGLNSSEAHGRAAIPAKGG